MGAAAGAPQERQSGVWMWPAWEGSEVEDAAAWGVDSGLDMAAGGAAAAGDRGRGALLVWVGEEGILFVFSGGEEGILGGSTDTGEEELRFANLRHAERRWLLPLGRVRAFGLPMGGDIERSYPANHRNFPRQFCETSRSSAWFFLSFFLYILFVLF